MHRKTYLIIAIICCFVSALSTILGLVLLDPITVAIITPATLLPALGGCVAWCGWYASQPNPQSPELTEFTKNKSLKELKSQILYLLHTPSKAISAKQIYIREGKDNAYMYVLKLIEKQEQKHEQKQKQK